MKLFSIIIALFAFVNLSASVGIVKDIDGRVKVQHQDSIKKVKVKVGFEIQKGDLIITSKRATAVLQLKDGSDVVLAPNSSIHFKSITDVEQKEGKAYYHITSRDAKNSLGIKTPFAIIGIKGTTFVIDAAKNGSVSLKEGLIGVSSIEKEFNLYKKKVLDEFAQYQAQQMGEFAKFQKDAGYEPPIKTKSFDLPAGKRISFNGLRVNEDDWNVEDDDTFSVFESILAKTRR